MSNPVHVLKFIELKFGYNDNGPAWIAPVKLSKSRRTVYCDGRALKHCIATLPWRDQNYSEHSTATTAALPSLLFVITTSPDAATDSTGWMAPRASYSESAAHLRTNALGREKAERISSAHCAEPIDTATVEPHSRVYASCGTAAVRTNPRTSASDSPSCHVVITNGWPAGGGTSPICASSKMSCTRSQSCPQTHTYAAPASSSRRAT